VIRAGNEDGVSGVIGAILLVGVIAAAVGLVGVGILSQPPPEKIPSLSAEIAVHGDMILISHYGGDSFDKSALSILMDGTDMKDSFSLMSGSSWSTWVIGDTLVYQVPAGQEMPDSIQLVYTGGRSGSILQTWGSGTGAATPAPTTTVTTTPVTTTTTPVPPLPVTADFTGTPMTGYSPLAVQFTDASTGPVTSRFWSFGDGSTSTAQDPTYTYPAGGSWTVGLTVGNGTGTHTLTKTDYIAVSTPVAGTITMDVYKPAYLEAGGYLQFQITGTTSYVTVNGVRYDFDAGDTVRLVVENNEYGVISASSPTLITTFSVGNVSLYENGAYVNRGTVSAIQISHDAAQYQSTLNLYVPPASAPDTYLNVDGTTLINYEQSSVAIRLTGLGATMNLNPSGPARSYYSGDAAGYQILGPQVTGITPASGEAGTTVTITDLSGMYFEPGSSPSVKLRKGATNITATSVNVLSTTRIQCTFSLAGAETGQWDVVVTNAEGQSGVGSGLFTVVPGPLAASFTYTLPSSNTVRFTDTSTGGATTWDWDFGDGTAHAYVQNPPDHTYAAGGNYPVTLMVTDGSQSNSSQQIISIFLPATHTASLDATKNSYLELGGVMQFDVTGQWSYIIVNGENYPIDQGDTVRLVMGSDVYGTISSSSTMITTFDFDDVTLYVNDVYKNRGTVGTIYINGHDNYQSTLNLYMPSVSGQTYFKFDDDVLINWATSSSAVRITGLSGAMQLTAASNRAYYTGSATGYSMS
jgi:PKD repeat protein